MQTISLDESWIETARLFGDVNQIVTEALRAYSLEQCRQRINAVASKIAFYSQKYQCDYPFFKNAVQTDEAFLAKIEAENPLWEEDAMEWAYWIEEETQWRTRQARISNN
jgi:hypothetical protein